MCFALLNTGHFLSELVVYPLFDMLPDALYSQNKTDRPSLIFMTFNF